MTGSIDLNPNHLAIVLGILAEHVPECEVRAFGSRASWTSSDYSDLDLAIVGEGELHWRTLARLNEAFEESRLPMQVDVLDWHAISEDFRKLVEREYVVVKEKVGSSAVRANCKTKTLGEVADIIMGQSPPGDTVSSDHGVALLNGPTEFGAHHPTPVQFTTDARKRAHPGDLLFCVRGSTTGRMNWADQEYAIGRGVAAIRHRDETALQPFVRGVIEIGLSELLTQATGSTFPNVSAHQLAEIPYPNLGRSEQREIAHVLGSLDDKIELNRRMNETLEAMARALFKSWFVDFDPVRAKIEGRWRRGESLPGLPAEYYDLFPGRLVDSELGEIPEGWEDGTVSQLAKRIQNGGTPKRSEPRYWESREIPWLTSGEVRQSFILQTQNFISREGLAQSSAKMVPARSILVALYGATAGQVSMNFRPLSTNQAVSAIIPSKGNRYFCLVSLKGQVPELENRAVGSAQQNISKKAVESTNLVLPPVELRSVYDALVERLFDRIFQNWDESCILTTQRDALLPNLVTGEVRILCVL